MAVRRILALTDLSEVSCHGLELADTLARRFHGKVVVGHAQTRGTSLRGLGAEEERLVEWARREDRDHLARLVRKHIDKLRLESVEMIEATSAREGVGELVKRVKPDLVCMATHGRTGFKHMLLGSIAEHTLRTARVPVAVTKGSPLPPLEDPLRMMVTLDLLGEPERFVREVAALLQPTDVLLLAHVVESGYFSPAPYGSEFALPQPDVPRLREAAEMRLRQVDPGKSAPRREVRVDAGRPGETLLAIEREWRPHVVVARTHGRRGFDRMMLGSVSEFLARRCRSVVLVYPKA